MGTRKLVIKLTVGQAEAERCGQALSIAATAVASGVPVSLWLAGEAAWFAVPERLKEVVLAHSPPLTDLFDRVLAAGTVTLCTQCAARRDITPADIIDGVRIAGAPTFVAEVAAEDSQALVY